MNKYKNNKKFSNKFSGRDRDFQKFEKFQSPQNAEKIRLEKVSPDIKGDLVVVEGIVDRVSQTGGPTLFTLSDGTGTLVLKGFVGPGERAYPEISEEDIISATVKINEYQDAFEGKILKIRKLQGEDAKRFHENIELLQRERAQISPPQFMVDSPILEKLKDRFTKAATEIRLAIFQNRPIIIRHHNDTDGYSSGFSLERAVLPLIDAQHKSAKASWEFYTRAPCAAPFYEIEDSIRDTSMSLANAAKFSNKMPLVIIADNGSAPDDLFAIQQGKVHGMKFIVVDHHIFDKDVISQEVLVHINPFLVGEDGAKFSAGMLCSELARFINPDVKNIEQIPAMAGLADRIDNPSVINEYLKIAARHGYTKELLSDISTVIDFVSAKLRFMEAREYIEVVFGEPKEKQRALVNLMTPYIRNLEKKGLEIAKTAAQLEKIGKTTLQYIHIEQSFSRGFYPKPGKAVGLIHDHLQEAHKLTNVVTVGILEDAMTIRATDEANFSVHDFIAYINKHLPQSFVEGGGHKNAGSIKYIPSQKDKIFHLLKEFIKGRS